MDADTVKLSARMMEAVADTEDTHTGTCVVYRDDVLALAAALEAAEEKLGTLSGLLMESCRVIQRLAEQQAMADDWYAFPLAQFLAAIEDKHKIPRRKMLVGKYPKTPGNDTVDLAAEEDE